MLGLPAQLLEWVALNPLEGWSARAANRRSGNGFVVSTSVRWRADARVGKGSAGGDDEGVRSALTFWSHWAKPVRAQDVVCRRSEINGFFRDRTRR